MAGKIRYFLFNKESDFRRGFLQDMTIEDGGICPVKDSGKKGIFISRLLDSREAGMSWHRLRMKGRQGDRNSFRISIYATEEREYLLDGKMWDLDAYLQSEDIPVEEKIRHMEPLLQKQTVGMDDLILHDITGRYLFVMFEVYWQHDRQSIRDIQIFFPRQTWVSYLPEIYERYDEGMFLERYLGIFQSIHEDMNEQIAEMVDVFDRESTARQYLDWLADWIGIPESYMWTSEQLKSLVKNGISLFKKRGTRQGIIELIKLCTGEEPYLVEHHQIAEFKKNREQTELMRKLYGNRPDFFTMILKEELVDTPWKKETVIKLVDSFKPAHMDWQLIVIKPYLFVGEYTYLGVNTVLGSYGGLKLDGHSAMSLSVLEGGEE